MNGTIRSFVEPVGTQTYSHGLEKIYQYEVVNPATVQPLVQLSTIQCEKKESTAPTPLQIEEQFFFDFGQKFAQSITPLQLEEPLESLELSAFAYKAIANKGCKTVADVCTLLPQIQGIGQSHLDEISEKIERFVGKKAFAKRTTVDFLSLLRILLHKIDAKERFIFLERHELTYLFPIKPNEVHEVEKWGQEVRQKIIQKILQTVNKKYLEEKLEAIGYSLIVPWLNQRAGFAPYYELEERLIMLSENKDEERLYNIKNVLEEIADIPSLFTFFLIEVSPGIYAQNHRTAELYNRVIDRAKGYFYAAHVSYPLHQLVQLIERDCVIDWDACSTNFIEKILRLDPYFVIWRNEKGILFIQL